MSKQTEMYTRRDKVKGCIEEEARQAGRNLRDAPPEKILDWGVRRFGRSLVLACSFGAEDVVLVHMLHQMDSGVDIFYLDTGVLFPETLHTRDRLSESYGISFIRVTPDRDLVRGEEEGAEPLWRRDPDACCRLRKVEPLKKVLKGYSAWCTGIRRDQSPTRAQTGVVEWDEGFHMVKLNPLAFWTDQQVWAYIRKHQVPYNPMHDRMYPSIGCIPCTRQVRPGEHPRAGRWAGMTKTECGLHLRSSEKKG